MNCFLDKVRLEQRSKRTVEKRNIDMWGIKTILENGKWKFKISGAERSSVCRSHNQETQVAEVSRRR